MIRKGCRVSTSSRIVRTSLPDPVGGEGRGGEGRGGKGRIQCKHNERNRIQNRTELEGMEQTGKERRKEGKRKRRKGEQKREEEGREGEGMAGAAEIYRKSPTSTM